MLFGDNVLDVMRQFAVVPARAILTTILRTLANKVACGGIHSLAVGFQVTLRLEFQD